MLCVSAYRCFSVVLKAIHFGFFQAATPEQAESLRSGYKRLIDKEGDSDANEGAPGMGQIYQVMAVSPKGAPSPFPF